MARVLKLLGCGLIATISSAHLITQQPIMESIRSDGSINTGGCSPEHSFEYHKDKGPISWYGMDPAANSLCATGRHQSPINIEPGKVPLTVLGVWLNLSTVPSAVMKNNGHTVQVELPDMGTLIHPFPRGTQYWLKQFHFHTPSEHHINGIHYDIELHMVFKSARETYAVLAQTYIVSDGDSDAFLRMLPDDISDISQPGSERKVGPIDFADTITRWKSEPSYTYPGSLTTPPCTEGVTWFVARTAQPIYHKRFNFFRAIMGFNARIVQNQYAEQNLLMGAGNALKANGAL